MQFSTVVTVSICMTLLLFVPQIHASFFRYILRYIHKSMFTNHFFSDIDIKSLIMDDDSVEIRYWKPELGNNKSIKIRYSQEEELIKHWVYSRPLKVIVHGWLDSTRHDNGVYCIKTAYIKIGGYNVISVDWGKIAANKNYMFPLLMTTKIGNLLARMIDKFVTLNLIAIADIHLIGHSLGAHIAGACGTSVTAGKIGRITGLDPAGPGYEYAEYHKTGLKKSDADFVDVIHTSGGATGCYSSMGHVDFYPNGGTPPQPGCYGGEIQIRKLIGLVECSHSRAYKLYEDSLYNRFSLMGVQCYSWSAFKDKACDGNPVAPMGHDATPKLTGDFYLQTEKSAPFGLRDPKDTSTTKNDL